MHFLQLKSGTEPTLKSFSGITLNGTTYDSYSLFTGGINFSLNKSGNLTMLSGMSYQGQGDKGNLSDIYYIDNSIGTKTLKKIYKIYKDKNGSINYKFDSSDLSSDETLVFDLYKMSTENLMQIGAIYYFEFPMLAGDYFMTRVGNSSVYVPYIYYLDIGANAGDSGGDSGDEKTSEIDFVYYDNKKLKKITDTGYTNSKVLFDLGGSASGLIAFKRTYDGNNNLTVYYYPLTSTSISITIVGSGSTTGSDSKIDKNE